MKQKDILIILVFVFGIGCILMSFQLSKCSTCRSISMYPECINHTGLNMTFDANGIYVAGADYYCIWTKGRTYRGINSTEVHGQCHHLVHTDPVHFCKLYLDVI